MNQTLNHSHLGNEGMPGFDWSMYEDGWNGKSLKVNKKVKLKKAQIANNTIVYCREKYATKALKEYCKENVPVSKEINNGDILKITNLEPMTNGMVLATVANGANNIIIDLDKEAKFMNNIQMGDEKMTKDTFLQCLAHPEIKQQIISMDLSAKVGQDKEKASIWDGFVANLNREMVEQITKNTQAYIANVVGFNTGGLIVEISNAVSAFLPGSHLAINRLDVEDFSQFVGQSFEVMVESYRPGWGFIVSRKKYIQHILPTQLTKLAQFLEKNPDHAFTGKVTGTTKYGVFVQIDEFITGMLHKSLVSDEIREKMRNPELGEIGPEIQVYVHRIEENRVIFSDVCLAERDAIIAKREAEDEAEKAELAAANGETPKMEEVTNG